MNLCKVLLAMILSSFVANVTAAQISTDLEKFSYSMGVIFGQSVTRQNLDIDVPAFLQAVEDVLNKSEKKLTDDEMQEIINVYTKKEQEEQALRNNSNKTKGEKYLMENESKKGVTT